MSSDASVLPDDRTIDSANVNHFLGTSAYAFLLISVFIALYGVLRLAQATPHGMGIGGDSYYYLTAADNLAAGIGFGRLNGRGELIRTTHYPPGYPAAVAGFQFAGMDRADSVRWLNFLSLAALVLLSGFILRRETGSNYPAFVAQGFIATTPVVFGISVWAMSEPLYLATSFAGLLAFSAYLEKGNRWLLAGSALLVGFSLLTRYLGIALVGTLVIGLMFRPAPRRARLANIGLVLILALLPVALWMIRNLTVTGNVANRRAFLHLPTYGHFKSLVLHVLEWFVPAEFIHGGLQAAAFLVVLIAVGGWLLRKLYLADRLGQLLRRERMPFILVLHVVMYMAAFGVSLTLFDPLTQVANRILAPVYVTAIILVALAVWDAWTLLRRAAHVAVLAAFGGLVLYNASIQATLAESYGTYGLGNAAPSNSQSQTIAAVRDLPDVPIVTNGISRLYFWADRNSFAIPWVEDRLTGMPDQRYEENLRVLRGRLCEDHGVLVLFHPERLTPEQAPLGDMIEGLALYGVYPDGAIYSCQEEPQW